MKPGNEANPDRSHYDEGKEDMWDGEDQTEHCGMENQMESIIAMSRSTCLWDGGSGEITFDHDNESRLTTRTGRHIKPPNWMKDYVTH